MKKFLMLLALVVALIGFTACGTKESNKGTPWGANAKFVATTPKNIEYNSTSKLISWKAEPNNETYVKYLLIVNGKEFTTYKKSMSIEDCGLQIGDTAEIKIKSLSTNFNKNIVDSPWSDTVKLAIKTDQQELENVKELEQKISDILVNNLKDKVDFDLTSAKVISSYKYYLTVDLYGKNKETGEDVFALTNILFNKDVTNLTELYNEIIEGNINYDNIEVGDLETIINKNVYDDIALKFIESKNLYSFVRNGSNYDVELIKCESYYSNKQLSFVAYFKCVSDTGENYRYRRVDMKILLEGTYEEMMYQIDNQKVLVKKGTLLNLDALGEYMLKFNEIYEQSKIDNSANVDNQSSQFLN